MLLDLGKSLPVIALASIADPRMGSYSLIYHIKTIPLRFLIASLDPSLPQRANPPLSSLELSLGMWPTITVCSMWVVVFMEWFKSMGECSQDFAWAQNGSFLRAGENVIRAPIEVRLPSPIFLSSGSLACASFISPGVCPSFQCDLLRLGFLSFSA